MKRPDLNAEGTNWNEAGFDSPAEAEYFKRATKLEADVATLREALGNAHALLVALVNRDGRVRLTDAELRRAHGTTIRQRKDFPSNDIILELVPQ